MASKFFVVVLAVMGVVGAYEKEKETGALAVVVGPPNHAVVPVEPAHPGGGYGEDEAVESTMSVVPSASVSAVSLASMSVVPSAVPSAVYGKPEVDVEKPVEEIKKGYGRDAELGLGGEGVEGKEKKKGYGKDDEEEEEPKTVEKPSCSSSATVPSSSAPSVVYITKAPPVYTTKSHRPAVPSPPPPPPAKHNHPIFTGYQNHTTLTKTKPKPKSKTYILVLPSSSSVSTTTTAIPTPVPVVPPPKASPTGGMPDLSGVTPCFGPECAKDKSAMNYEQVITTNPDVFKGAAIARERGWGLLGVAVGVVVGLWVF